MTFCMRLNLVIKHFLESFLQRIEISKLNPVRKMYHKTALFLGLRLVTHKKVTIGFKGPHVL